MPISCLQTFLHYLLYIFYTNHHSDNMTLHWSFVKMFCLVVSNRVHLIHRFTLEKASPNLFPHLPLPGSSFWWVGPGEVLCNQMHHCISQRNMSLERGREAGRGRKRVRLYVWIDHTMTLGEARVTSHEMVAIPWVCATITHSSLVLNWLRLPHIQIYIKIYIGSLSWSWFDMCMSEYVCLFSSAL